MESSDVIRLDMDNIQEPWAVGQHYYLCFTQGSIWQSHPFTPLNAPVITKGKVRHSYILRAKKGETKRIIDLAATGISNTPVILTGPYGGDITRTLTPDTNILCVAGGTGITYVLPVLFDLARLSPSPYRNMELIWAIRHTSNTDWISEELDILQKAKKAMNLKIRIFATRDSSNESSPAAKGTISFSVADETDCCEVSPALSESPSCRCEKEATVENLGGESEKGSTHPDLHKLIPAFLEEVVKGPTTVFVSGPGGMVSDVRGIVASCNSGPKVWSGQERSDVSLVCDDRLEW